MVEVAVIVRPGHEDRVRGKAGIYLERAGFGRCAGEGDVHLAALQQAEHLVAAPGDDLDMDGGILAVEAVEKRQQELTGHRVARADGQVAHLEMAALGELLLPRLEQADGAADILIEHLAVRRERHAAGIACEQARLQLGLELLDRLAHRGLGDKKGRRGGGDIPGLGDLLEHLV